MILWRRHTVIHPTASRQLLRHPGQIQFQLPASVLGPGGSAHRAPLRPDCRTGGVLLAAWGPERLRRIRYRDAEAHN